MLSHCTGITDHVTYETSRSVFRVGCYYENVTYAQRMHMIDAMHGYVSRACERFLRFQAFLRPHAITAQPTCVNLAGKGRANLVLTMTYFKFN
jgi:hypothetical protein